jgi:PAS domain S-box-containing protein
MDVPSLQDAVKRNPRGNPQQLYAQDVGRRSVGVVKSRSRACPSWIDLACQNATDSARNCRKLASRSLFVGRLGTSEPTCWLKPYLLTSRVPDSRNRRRLYSYLLACTAVLAMALLRWALTPLLGETLPYITFFPAVFFAAWYGGAGPALVATAASALIALFFFMPTPPTGVPGGSLGIIGTTLFVLVGVTTALMGESRLRALMRAGQDAQRAEDQKIRAEQQTSRSEQLAIEAETAVAQQTATERVLRESQERYRAFIEQTAEGVWRFELEKPVPVHLPVDEQIERFYADSYLAECNDAVAQMYGYEKADQLLGARLADMMPRNDPQNLEYLRAFVRSGYRLTDAESHEFDREGNERYFLNNLIGIVSEGHIARAWGSQRDVTASRQAEAAIQASEARFRSVFEAGMIGIAFWNGSRMTDANDTLLAMLGYTRQDMAD